MYTLILFLFAFAGNLRLGMLIFIFTKSKISITTLIEKKNNKSIKEASFYVKKVSFWLEQDQNSYFDIIQGDIYLVCFTCITVIGLSLSIIKASSSICFYPLFLKT